MLTVLILAAVALTAAVVLAPLAIRRAYRAPRVQECGSPMDFGLPFREVRVPTVGGKTLFAWLVLPVNRGVDAPAVVVMHGWGGNAQDMLPLAVPLHREGYAVLLLDARNHGRSDADSFSSMPRFAEDLERGLDWLARQPNIDRARLVLLGHSVGAGAALLVAARRADLAAVISIAAFAHPAELMRRQMRAKRIPFWPIGWLVLRFIEQTIDADFDEIAPSNTIGRVSCPVLLAHGDDDRRVPPADARRIYANRRDERTELLMLPETGHDSTGAIQVHAKALAEFLRRWVATSPSAASSSTENGIKG